MVGAPTFEGGELKEWLVYWLRTLVVRASNARGKDKKAASVKKEPTGEKMA